MGYNQWWQQHEDPDALYQMGYNQWWQAFEAQVLEMGYNQWWQVFEQDMLNMGYNQWWQVFEMGYNQWWQKLDTYFSTLESVGDINSANINAEMSDYGVSDMAVVVSGGDADDILAGSSFRDLVSGGGGDDLIDGKAGDDNILGEAGQDILYGAAGRDKIYGGQGDDFILGETGNDRLFGEDGHDIIFGGQGNDVIEGGSGKDLLDGDDGSDVLDGGIGKDDVDGGDGRDIVIGGQGQDIVSGGRGDDILFGDRYAGATSAGNAETASIDLAVVSEQAGFSDVGDKSPIDFWVRLEAEDLKLTNFSKISAEASGGGLISTSGVGNAEAKFTGPTGIYDIVVGYHDESDGAGNVQIDIGDQSFDWTFNKSLGDAGVSAQNFTTHTLRGVRIESGEMIDIQATSQGYEFMRIDYIDVISTTQGTAFTDAHFYNGGLYLQNMDAAAAAELGGTLLELGQGSPTEHWLNNTLGQTENIAKVDISHTQFNVVLDEATLSTKNTLRLEAENFVLGGDYAVEARTGYASGGAAIAVNGSNGGTATATFTGKSGLYNVFVGYIDERGSTASATFSINDQTLDSWDFNAAEDQSGYRTVASQRYLEEGDTIQIQGWASNNDNRLNRKLPDSVE